MLTPKTPVVELKNIRKTFGDFVANEGIHLNLYPGEIHGLVGENGAGKSTLVKMIYGLHSPDSGEILVHGKSVKFNSPEEAIRIGIGMVQQHFTLSSPETAFENLCLGVESEEGKPIGFWKACFPYPRKKILERLKKIASDTGFEIPWDEPVSKLPVGLQQRIEILKPLFRGAKILILDEPTAVLTPSETDELFKKLRKLAEEGASILVISHKLREIRNFTDRFTVLREGKVTGSGVSSQITEKELAQLMVGREVNFSSPSSGGSASSQEKRKTVFEMDLRRGLSFEVKSGEIVGIAGVEGNGQSEILASVLVNEKMGRLPEDRLKEGLLLDFNLKENFLLSKTWRKKFSKFGWINWKSLSSRGEERLQKFDVRPPDLAKKASSFSGGNQQKFVFSRELEGNPEFLVAAHPTRGVDIGAIEFLHAEIRAAKSRGSGVLLISSELDEVLALSDRVLVLFKGEIIREFSMSPFSVQEVGLAMGGGRK